MSFNTLPEHYTLDYSQNWLHRIQQMPSKLAGTTKEDSINGFQKRYAQLEKQAMQEITVRHGSTARQDATSYHRWLKTKKHDIANVIDEWDQKELGVLISPQGALVENHGYAYNRLKDRTIIEALEGNATTGEDGDVLTALSAGQQISVDYVATGAAANSGLTFAKVVEARRLFNENDLPLDGSAYAIISPQADADLVRDVDEAKNKDFGNITPVSDGTLHGKYWMGFNWICHTDLTDTDGVSGAGTTTANVTNCLFYHKSQVVFGDGEKRSTIDILPENSHGIQVRTRCRMGALRMEEKGVVLVEAER
jgi:hypothetical protein